MLFRYFFFSETGHGVTVPYWESENIDEQEAEIYADARDTREQKHQCR